MKNLQYVFLCICCSACTGSSGGGGDTEIHSQLLDSGADSDVSFGDTGLSDDAQMPLDTGVMDALVMPVADQMVGPPDAGQLERCTPLGRCNSAGGWCETAQHPSCWRGEAPACFDPLHPLSRASCGEQMDLTDASCTCPANFQAGPGEDVCVQATSVRATENGERLRVCTGPRTTLYGSGGAVYEDTDGNPNNNAVLDSYWGPIEPTDRNAGRLNQAGVWACDWQVPDQSGLEPLNEWIGFSHCLGVDEPGDYLVGLSGDNRVRLRVNGLLVFESPEADVASNYWYVRRLSLNSGINIVEVLGYNTDNVGSLGAEISGPFEKGSLETEAQQKAADYAGRIVFTTTDTVGQDFDLGTASGWSCPEANHVVNTCREPTRCTEIQQVACELPPLVCPDGQHVSDEVCLDNECTCPFGVPTVGEDCPINGAQGCQACFEGFYLEQGVCLENECECDNGTAAGSAACIENGAQLCLFCDPGYRLEERNCLPFQCLCENGTGTSGIHCPQDGANMCDVCDAGFHLEDGQCMPNQCLCRHGVFDEAAPCPVDGGEACTSCRGGYHLEDGQCLLNLCVCENGNGAVGPDCWLNDAAWCTQCMAGHRLVEGQCIANQCVCFNGTGAAGGQCPNNGGLRCAQCDPGFRLEGNVCVQAGCLCANGQPTVGAACPEPGTNHCASCLEGFQLTDENICQPIQCPCDNGQPAVGQPCPDEGGQLCINCDPGYDFSDGLCLLRACQCENGTAAVGVECAEAGGAHCAECDDGYILDAERCLPVP